MKQFVQASLTVARRDFMAIVATPSFLLFLLAPLLFIGIGAASALGTKTLAQSGGDKARLVAILPPDELMLLKQADDQMRAALGLQNQPHSVSFETASASGDALKERFATKDMHLYAMLYGRLDQPILLKRQETSNSEQYLALLVQQAVTLRDQGVQNPVEPVTEIIPFPRQSDDSLHSKAGKAISLGAVTIIFMLTLLLATQSISSIAEEKSNKVIEILAAAVPLESVFIGKLLAMLGVGLLFVAFWGAIIGLSGMGLGLWVSQSGAMLPADPNSTDFTMLAAVAPAVGWQTFLALSVIYMVMNFLLYGSLFLGIGSLAATTREIQMLSFPITMLQMIAYFVPLASFSADGASPIQPIAEVFPFTSPYAMVSKAATETGLVWHAVAIGWQLLWVAIVIAISVRLFRGGVLGGDQAWKFWRRTRV